VASPLAADPTLPRSPSQSDPARVSKKDRAPPSDEEGPVTTLTTLVHLHTDERLPLSTTEPTVDELSTFVEDRAMQSRVPVDPCLLVALRALATKHPGAEIDVVSGHRSAKRNEMMRKKGHHVASHSQHTLGKALDLRVEGLSPAAIAKELEALRWNGGLGRYDGKHDRFVHVDCGPKRRWRGR
jgi:uncharacterized protein YcbK (DUF882 family)